MVKLLSCDFYYITTSHCRCYIHVHPEPPLRALPDNVSTFVAYISASLKCGVNCSFKFTVPFRTDVYMFLFGRKGKEPSHGLGRWYENDDFNTEYFHAQLKELLLCVSGVYIPRCTYPGGLPAVLNTSLPTGPSVMISWVMDAPLTSLFAYIVS